MNKLEEKFYKIFKIKPVRFDGYLLDKVEIEGKFYNKITSDILLELMCILSTVYSYSITHKESVDELKEFILNSCIRNSEKLGIEQVQCLFKEYEDEEYNEN